LKAKSPASFKNFENQTFLQRIDLFLGHLKTFFEPKPAFFIHDLLFVLIACKEIFNLWSVGKRLVRTIGYAGNERLHEHEFLLMLFPVLFSFIVEVILVVQVWKFLRKTKFSLLVFATVSWAAIFGSISIFITQWIAAGYANHNGFKFKFDAGSYILSLLPWMLFYGLIIFLCSRKKIIVMHKISRRNFLFTPLYGLLWMIFFQGISFLIGWIVM
jgi:hypothetical protein